MDYDDNWDLEDCVDSDSSSLLQSWSFSLPTFSGLPQLPANPIPQLAQNLQGIRGYFPSNLNLPIFTSAMTSVSMPSMISSFPMPSLQSVVSSALNSVSFQDTSRKNWSQLKESVRRTQRKLFEITGRVPFFFSFAPLLDKNGGQIGTRIYFLCNLASGLNITLHFCDVHDSDKLTKSGKDSDKSANKTSSNSTRKKLLRKQQKQEKEIDHPIADLETEESTVPSNVSPYSINAEEETKEEDEDDDVGEKFAPPATDFEWKQLIDANPQYYLTKYPDGQEKLQLERKRLIFSGINEYEFNASIRRFVFTCNGHLFYFDDTGTPPYAPIPLKSISKFSVINPVMCPSNPDLIAYHSDGDMWVINIKTSQELRLTSTKCNEDRRVLSAGLPCYVIQEEFNRYEGFWWRPGSKHISPTCKEYSILYEEVDETQVELLHLPNMNGGVDNYRFPRAGGVNATSDLKLASFRYDESTQQISDSFCETIPCLSLSSLYSLYSDYEYLVRCGWHSRDSVWVQLLNRQQKHLVLGLFSISSSFPPQLLLREDNSPYWINVHDFIHFISPKKRYRQNISPAHHSNTNKNNKSYVNNKEELLKPGSEVKFIWISEKTGFRHLNLIRVQLVASEEKTISTRSNRSARNEAVAPRRIHGGPNNLESSFPPKNSGDEPLINHFRPTESQTATASSPEWPYELESNLIERRILTAGEWEVDGSDIWVDEMNELIYFVATKETPLERHLYYLSYKENGKHDVMNDFDPLNESAIEQRIVKLSENGFSHTCIAFNEKRDLFVNIQSNISYAPFGHVYKKVNPPPHPETSSSAKRINKNSSSSSSSSFRWTNQNSEPLSFEKLGLIVNNCIGTGINLSMGSPSPFSQIQVDVDTIPGMNKPELFKYQLKSSGETVYGLVFKPEFMDPGVKYPCVLDVYGGPEVQLVTNSFKGVRQPRRHLLACEGYVVVAFDCRGSHNRGTKFESHIQGRIGQVEIADHVEVLCWLAGTVDYIDMTRVAIHGWSYGGYLALMGLAQRPDIFRIAIAGAPVTNWALYDTGYTERYMDTPCANPRAYRKGNVLNYVNLFPEEENRLLLVHGMMDENVHFIHTQQLIQALVRAGKPYNLRIFPAERHSLRSAHSFEYNETMLLSFLEQNLKPAKSA